MVTVQVTRMHRSCCRQGQRSPHKWYACMQVLRMCITCHCSKVNAQVTCMHRDSAHVCYLCSDLWTRLQRPLQMCIIIQFCTQVSNVLQMLANCLKLALKLTSCQRSRYDSCTVCTFKHFYSCILPHVWMFIICKLRTVNMRYTNLWTKMRTPALIVRLTEVTWHA